MQMMQQSYFALLNLEPRFALPAEKLESAYRTLAMRVHPDRHAHAGLVEQRQALTLAADANEAYRTLKKPVLRAKHLLDLRGMQIGEHRTLPPEFLMEQMQRREALSEAQAARDIHALKALAAQVRNQAEALITLLETQLDVEGDNTAAALSVQKLMFVEKLAADIDEACSLLED